MLPGVLAVLGLVGCVGEGGEGGGEVTHGGLAFSDVVVTEPVTGERSALYLTVRDVRGEGDALLGLDVEGVGRASLHRTEPAEVGAVAMRPADSLRVEAGGALRLRPGGGHGMLEDLAAPWSAGDTVPVTLRFRRAGAVRVPARVVSYGDLDALFSAGGGP